MFDLANARRNSRFVDTDVKWIPLHSKNLL